MTKPVEAIATLSQLARRFDLRLQGDGDIRVAGVCALRPGQPGCIAFAEEPRQERALVDSGAAAVIVPESLANDAQRPVLISARPRLAFARVAAIFEMPPPVSGIHPSAIVDATASVSASAHIGPRAVVGARSSIGSGAIIGAGTVIGDDVHIGNRGRIASNVTIEARTRIGERVRIEAGAVIGARGFGLVHNGEAWEAIPQLGGVSLGDDVEVGAGTTIDRGAIDDTVVENGVKIDDQVHIGHNCIIGAHTVIAGCSGIAGSCSIGRNCMIGGGVGIGDHVHLADGVVLTAASQVPKDIDVPGVYSSTFRAMPARAWRKRLALFRRLDRMEQRLAGVEHRDKPKGE